MDKINWGQSLLGIDDIWRNTRGANVRVAVLDTGVGYHRDLPKGILAKDLTSGGDPYDTNGHGTACAGIVGARANGQGVVGVAPECDLLCGRVTDGDGDGGFDVLARGIDWACENGADVISISLGSWIPSDTLQEACDRAVAGKHWIIAAAGNYGVQYPAAYDSVISVGAIERVLWWLGLAEYSSRGSQIDVVAPGTDILCCWPPDGYRRLTGTSMACPFVAGVLALAISKHRTFPSETPLDTYQDVVAHLCKTAIDRGHKGLDENWGWGIINPALAIARADRIGDQSRLRTIA